jgi:hypothetical protein
VHVGISAAFSSPRVAPLPVSDEDDAPGMDQEVSRSEQPFLKLAMKVLPKRSSAFMRLWL